LHHEELRNFYSSLSIFTMVKPEGVIWAQHVTRMGEKRNAYSILVRKPLGRPIRRRVDNIKWILKIR
jgi:hypothetical protein